MRRTIELINKTMAAVCHSIAKEDDEEQRDKLMSLCDSLREYRFYLEKKQGVNPVA